MKDETAAWLASSERDQAAAAVLANSGFVEHAVFFLHLSVEKALKAALCELRGPAMVPRTHHLPELARRADLNPPNQVRAFLARLNPHSVSARYDSTDPGHTVVYTAAFHEELRSGALETVTWVRRQIA